MRAKTADAVSASILEVAARIETARAKVNLALHVGGRRADGYHMVDSLVVFTEVADTLRLAPRDEAGVRLMLDGQFANELAVATPDGNLVTRAADALMAARPRLRPAGATLQLTKRLPIASGVGGGSADAAAALRLLNRYWDMRMETAELTAIGAKIGADVPACLLSRPLRARGIGEQVTPLAGIPELPLLLVNPGVPVSTKAVFRRYAEVPRPAMPDIPARFGSILEFAQWLRRTRNDLFEPAVAEAKAIGTAVKALSADPDCLLARMSGSGATVFGIFMSRAAATRAAERIHARRPQWWLAVTAAAGS